MKRLSPKDPNSYCLRCKLEDCDEEDSRCLYRVAERLEKAIKQRDRLKSVIESMRQILLRDDRTEYYREYYQQNKERKKVWAENNREKINQRRRERNAKNSKKVRTELARPEDQPLQMQIL